MGHLVSVFQVENELLQLAINSEKMTWLEIRNISSEGPVQNITVYIFNLK